MAHGNISSENSVVIFFLHDTNADDSNAKTDSKDGDGRGDDGRGIARKTDDPAEQNGDSDDGKCFPEGFAVSRFIGYFVLMVAVDEIGFPVINGYAECHKENGNRKHDQ